MTISQITLIISGVITITMSAVIWVIARTYPKSIRGLSEWAWGSSIIAIALCLILARDYLPPLLGIIIPNLMILLAFILINAGTRRFAGHAPRNSRLLLGLFIALFIGLFCWFTFVEPNVAIRMMLLSLFTLAVCLDHLAFSYRELSVSVGRNLLLLSLLGLIASRLVRIFTLATGIDQPVSVFDNSISQLIIVATPAVMIPLSTISYLILVSERVSQELLHAVRHDDLTACLSRNAGTQILEHEIARSNRHHTPLSILFMDLDDFKTINDTYGHLAGDQVLQSFAGEARKCMRTTDSLVRFGGDEFLAILPNTTFEDAVKLAERISRIGSSRTSVPWSVSLGVAQWNGASDQLKEMLERADLSAYQSKKSNRDRVRHQ